MIAKAKSIKKVVSIDGKARKRAERAAERVGRSADEVEQLPFDLSALEDEGAFVNVDASGFGMLNRRLDWQALAFVCRKTRMLLFIRRVVGCCRTAIVAR